ncbi:ImmA/IrrE family metallo-endopeptidase [Butyrivibrio sp. ob235]|uniref:ImmA/IrrE family metallo-endopeptidase n=1 Tax=Butyrivibrio sp. ob235 TaxID=1761780 RepID=UPI001587DCD4|nr:ImmA/IrrE family metallo-endopeptidase [Butyrivibrio sp. ob235]
MIPDIKAASRIIFQKEGFKFLHIPMKSHEIGAFQLALNGNKYLVMNSSMSLANNNFAVAHELYHLIIQNTKNENGAEFYLNNYEENDDEMMANAFAGAIMMPAEDFISTASMLRDVNDASERMDDYYLEKMLEVLTLMEYYKTTYMSVVIRAYELGVFDRGDSKLIDFFLEHNDEKVLMEIFKGLESKLGTESIMEATYEDDFGSLLEDAKKQGQEYLKLGLITEEDLEYRINGMENAYESIKEGMHGGH